MKKVLTLLLATLCGASVHAEKAETKKQEKKAVLYHATSNPGKTRLFSQFIPESAHFSLERVDVELFEEQTDDQEAIAVAKAKQAWAKIKKPLIVDDFGVYFHKYHKFPGSFTKFVFLGLGFEGLCKLLDEGDEISKILITVLICGPEQYKVFVTREVGTFKKPKGNVPVDRKVSFESAFIPKGFDKSEREYTEENPKTCDQIYVRARAIREIADFISQNEVF